jgi:hypothetical protein
MEAAQASEFPRFSDGDVQVVISSAKIYQLHSVTLRRSSAYFAYLLDSEAPADLCSPARKAGRSVRYRFELARPVAPGSGVGVFHRTVGFHPITLSDSLTRFILSRVSPNGESLLLVSSASQI